MPRRSPDQTSKAPTLLGARATGGIHAGDGFIVQDRYLALRLPAWLADPTFQAFQTERSEDVDVWFDDGRDHHQVKNENLAKGDVRRLIEEFSALNAKLVVENRVRRYVLACAYLSPEMRRFAKNLAIYRSRRFGSDDADEREATLDTLRSQAARLGLGTLFEFIVARVLFDQDLRGLDTGTTDARDLLAAGILRQLGLSHFDEGVAIADAVLKELAQDRKRAWTRAELGALLEAARRAYRQGPPRPAGDLIVIKHETLQHVDVEPHAEDHRELIGERRVVRVDIDGVHRMRSVDAQSIEAVAHELASSEGAYAQALMKADARILYFGFPHVPFAALAGHLAGSHRGVALVEHDLETGRFMWRPAAPTTAPDVVITTHAKGAVARIRISVSALVREDVCGEVLPPDDVRLGVHIEASEITRGTVASEAQAREYAERLRRALDQHVAGDPWIDEVHVFAAVPVSVAFRVGQVLAHSSLPRSYVYNFDATATPRYCWRLDLREAAGGRSCVEVIGRK